jgi:DNA polymerase/3'-5' exonuclease PolX
MRLAAKEMGWKLNEYHLYDENGDIIPTESEADVQKLLGFEEANPEERA